MYYIEKRRGERKKWRRNGGEVEERESCMCEYIWCEWVWWMCIDFINFVVVGERL